MAVEPPYPLVHLIVRLRIPEKPEREFAYDFKQDVISMGRDPTNDIQIPLTTVSRRHSRIFFEQGDYFLEDLGSTHGTQHNGRRLHPGERRLLRDNDQIDIMSFNVTFKSASSTGLDRQPGEKTEALARRMVQEVLSSLDSSRTDLPSLRVMNGGSEGLRYELKDQQAEVVIGRSPECDLAIDDQNMSRRHCLIKRSWHGFTAQDLGSKNGVLVNDVRIDGAKMLKDGDELQMGGVRIVFIDPPSRLLDQIGGASETDDVYDRDARAAGGEGHADGEGDDGEYEDEVEGQGEGDAVGGPTAGARSGYDGDPDHEVEPPAHGPGLGDELEPFEESEEIREAREAFEKVQKRGVLVDVVVLVAGLVIFLGAIAFMVLFFL
ncbi:MAG: FHA domain-containing protein [Deltaproteobacteria bacterium]|nr:FHA domain-containing protein [Deltaproteobacteria bacterium]